MLTGAPAEPDDPLKRMRDEAFMKLGRNVALFQQLESGLKALYASLVVEGWGEASVEAMQEKRKAVLASRSLGVVINAVFDALTEDERDDEEPKLQGEKQAYFRFRFGTTGSIVDQQRASLASLVDERNRIVHHLTDDFDLRCPEGIAALDAFLDPQAERIRSEIRALQQLFESHLAARKLTADFVASPAFHAQMELDFLKGSALIRGMAAVAQELRRNDGWTALSTAAQELRRREPQAFADLKARYGHEKLKPLLLASRLFELQEEPSARGGSRVVYRRARAESSAPTAGATCTSM